MGTSNQLPGQGIAYHAIKDVNCEMVQQGDLLARVGHDTVSVYRVQAEDGPVDGEEIQICAQRLWERPHEAVVAFYE